MPNEQVNAYDHTYDSYSTAKDYNTFGKRGSDMFGIAWAMAWAAHREDWPRVTLLHRWLAEVGPAFPQTQPTLATIGEFYSYDCVRLQGNRLDCFGDPGNGVMVGWFLWAQVVVRRHLGLPIDVALDS